MSKSEGKISKILYTSNTQFITEKNFPDLMSGRLRYDFYLPIYNILIEYDGEQHFKEIPKFHHAYNDFAHYIENDRRKNSYALAHSIPLYRIPYWELKNISTLDDILSKKFLVHSKWHNDELRQKYFKNS